MRNSTLIQMIVEGIDQQPQHSCGAITNSSNNNSNTSKYCQFATILEHVIDCFHTIVSDETNPYHPPLAWLTRKQPKAPNDELFLALWDECSSTTTTHTASSSSSGCATSVSSSLRPKANTNNVQLSSSVRTRLERCSLNVRKKLVSRTKDGCSPLFMACKLNYINIIKYLIDLCGADIEQLGRYEVLEDHHTHSVSPIWVAAVSGNLETVKLLIDYGANINSLSDTGSTPLRSVCFLCRDDDFDEQQQEQSLAEVELDLFSWNIYDDEDEDNNTDKRPHIDSHENKYMKIVKLLVDNGADPAKPNYHGGTCLINSLHHYRLTEYIIDQGVDVDACDHQSKTALHYAIQQGRLDVTKLLVARNANPFLRTNSNDDALQLCCIFGHEEIANYLIENFYYPPSRLVDAYKLLGSSILEIHYDLSRVRKLWEISLQIQDTIQVTENNECYIGDQQASKIVHNTTQGNGEEEERHRNKNENNNIEHICDIRRLVAFGDIEECASLAELQSLSADDFRIQSLMMSERILGANHREIVQRLLYRGTHYMNSLRPNRCIDLWIYALALRLKHDSIFHFESIFAAQAITKLFLDMLSQNQLHQVKFDDVFDVLSLLVERLDDCKRHLELKPTWSLHEEIFDLLLGIIVNLLLLLECIAIKPDKMQQLSKVIGKLCVIKPQTSKGASLLHICVGPGMFEGEAYKSLQIMTRPAEEENGVVTEYSDDRDIVASRQTTQRRREPQAGANKRNNQSLVVQLIEALIDSGLDVDALNDEGLSALQVLCMASVRTKDKKQIVRLLVEKGAHVDRRSPTPEQGELTRHALLEAGVTLCNTSRLLVWLLARQLSLESSLTRKICPRICTN